jgi:hypothetical protein
LANGPATPLETVRKLQTSLQAKAKAERFDHRKRLDAYVVNYADDLVICCRSFMVARGNGRREIATGQPSLFFTQAAQHTAIQEETR